MEEISNDSKRTYLGDVRIYDRLRDYLKKVCPTGRFRNQTEIAKALFVDSQNSRSPLDHVPNQSTIQRHLKTMEDRDVIFKDYQGSKYVFRKFKDVNTNEFRFELVSSHLVSYTLEKLSERKRIFIRRYAFPLTKTTLVFHISEDAHKGVIGLLNELPKDMFWGISSQGEYIYLMFNKEYAFFEDVYKEFASFRV